ncbi:hypothetical protein MRX96_016840 [Rhipicephalus microplus]
MRGAFTHPVNPDGESPRECSTCRASFRWGHFEATGTLLRAKLAPMQQAGRRAPRREHFVPRCWRNKTGHFQRSDQTGLSCSRGWYSARLTGPLPLTVLLFFSAARRAGDVAGNYGVGSVLLSPGDFLIAREATAASVRRRGAWSGRRCPRLWVTACFPFMPKRLLLFGWGAGQPPEQPHLSPPCTCGTPCVRVGPRVKWFALSGRTGMRSSSDIHSIARTDRCSCFSTNSLGRMPKEYRR